MSREEAERLAREFFGRQIEVCEAFLTLASELVESEPWGGRPLDDSQFADKLIAAESARGLKTFRASFDAAIGGFGPQAAMMNRSLFEGMGMAYWVRANPADAATMFHKHRRHARGLWSKRLVAQGEEPLDDLPEEAEQQQLDKLFGSWGTTLWCGLSMPKLVDAIEPQWDDGAELRGFFRIAHADNNETQHTTAMSLASPLIADTESSFAVDAGRSLHYVARTLYGGFWSYAHLLKLTADYFEIDGREQVQPAFERGMAIFAPLDEAAAKDVGRNDPCPCGSGVKFKRCHGA